jgi:hypothetical protein
LYTAAGRRLPVVFLVLVDELAVAAKEAFSAAGGPHMIIVDVAPGVPLEG